MTQLGLDRDIVDQDVLDRAIEVCRDRKILLPTFAQLADPTTIPESINRALTGVDPDAADPLNLFRVHWHNGSDRRSGVSVPDHVVLPRSLTGVAAPIAVAFGDRFPMIRAHKVLPAYGCLVPRFVTGRFDPSRHRALWPSTGNYCRGGVAISRIMGCRGVAILPEGMSEERFNWLDEWVLDPSDVIRTPGTESNVKEIYDACEQLDRDPGNIIFNQFCEFANHIIHRLCTGRALERVFEHVRGENGQLTPRVFVSASGSAGTLAAGNHLKARFGTQIAVSEALECPTLLKNGFGEHNIQGIGDKHVPLIHDVMNTDIVVAVSDRATDHCLLMANSDSGRAALAGRHGVPQDIVDALAHFGLSSFCNVISAIKIARELDLGENDLILTVATDGAEMYGSEFDRIAARDFAGGYTDEAAEQTIQENLLGATTDNLLVLDELGRERVFNLGYFTWVEQRGISLDEFVARRERKFWDGLMELPAIWDGLIDEMNARTGVLAAINDA